MAKSIANNEGAGVKRQLITGVKAAAGVLLMTFLPKRRKSIEEIATIPWHSDKSLNGVDRLIRAGILWLRSRDKSGAEMSKLHQGFWREQSADEYYAGTANRFEKLFLPHFDQFIDVVGHTIEQKGIRNVVEIGCGDGQLLRHLKRKVLADRYIGLDLSKDQIKKNLEADQEQTVEYYSGDAAQWIAEKSPSSTLYVTGLGVLEYFTQSQLTSLLSNIANTFAPAAALFIEPVDKGANFIEFDESYVAGEEHSFTHNYAKRLTESGWSISHTEELHLAPYRWLVIIASCDKS